MAVGLTVNTGVAWFTTLPLLMLVLVTLMAPALVSTTRLEEL